MKILLFGFEKFSNLPINPSKEIVEDIHAQIKNKHKAIIQIASVTTNATKKLQETIHKIKPDLILGIGLSDRSIVSLEHNALNILDSPKPHSDKKIIRNAKIDPKAPLALETSMPLQKLEAFLKSKNIPVKISYNAGTYLCNYAYFHCLNEIQKHNLQTQCLFIHIPFSPYIVNKLEIDKPSFPPHLIAQALSGYILKQH